MSFTVNSSHQALFNGDFYAQVQITVTRNNKDNTFTVKVDGLRGYSKYEWNFGQRVQMWLATDSSGSNKVNLTSSYVSISSSGSDSYKGWIPRTGYATNCSVTKTYKGNSDGTCPNVWLYFRDYNPGIKWVSNGTTVSLDVSYKGNIKSLIAEDVGANDVSAPTVTVTPTGLTATSISWTATSDVKCNKWEYNLDGAGYKSYSTEDKTSTSKTLTGLSSGTHKIKIRGTKTTNGKTDESSEVSYDCNCPTISDFNITPESASSVSVSFKCNYACKYMIKKPGDTAWPSSWTNGASAGNVTKSSIMTVPNTNGTYYLRVKRTSDDDLVTESSTTYDMRLPAISTLTVTPASNTKATVSFNVNSYEYKYRLKCPDGTYIPESGYSAACTGAQSISINAKDYNGAYTLYVQRTSSVYLRTERTSEGDNRAPVIERFKLTPISSTTAEATILVNLPFRYRIRRPSGTYSTWSNNCAGGVQINPIISAESVDGKYTLEVERTYSNKLTADAEARCDCRLPDVTDLVLTPKSVNTASLSVKSSFDCYWHLSDRGSGTSLGSYGPCKEITNQNVTVLSDTLGSYVVRAQRKECTTLQTEREIYCDTMRPRLSFDSLRSESNMVMFTASAAAISGNCKDWRVEFTDASGSSVVCRVLAPEGTSINYMSQGLLDPGVRYDATVYATRVSNGIEGSAQYNGQAQLSGTVRVYDGNEFRFGAVYIYDGRNWRVALPYICVNPDGETEDEIWKLAQ